MKTLASAACVLLLLGAGASAQTLDDLKKDGNGGSTDNVLTYGMGYHQQRYSPLKQVNKQTVKRLVPVWNLSLDNNWGEQAQPIVYNGVMYDAKDGKELWKSKVADWKDGVSLTLAPLIANGVLVIGNSGAEFGVRGFIDGYDTATGKQLWRKYTIPARGEKGNETWPQDNNAWEMGAGSAWGTGSYD